MSKIDPETAEQEFQRIAKARRLDTNTAAMDKKDAAAFLSNKEVLVEAIKTGQMVVDEHGQPTLHLEFPIEAKGGSWKSLTFYRPKGAMLTASDGFDENDRGARMHAMLASVCKIQSRAVFDEMDWADHKICQALFSLFLA